MPAGHTAAHAVAPEKEKAPIAQSEHCVVVPGAGATLPAGHGVQTLEVAPDAANEPAAQGGEMGEHEALPAVAANVPPTHATHDAPDADNAVPAGHATHPAPSLAATDPGGQAAHEAKPVEALV